MLAPLVTVALAAAGCDYPSYAFATSPTATSTLSTNDGAVGDDANAIDASTTGGDDAGADGGESGTDATTVDSGTVDATDADAPVVLPAGSCKGFALNQDLRNHIPALPSGVTVTVDGDASEWCTVPGLRFDAAACNWLEPSVLPAFAADANARVRMAWRAGADAASSFVYFDAVVADASLNVAPPTSDVDQGASLTLYLGAPGGLSGAYDDTADRGATAFVLAPPQGTSPARGAVDIAGAQAHGLPVGVVFGAREVMGGYEIELAIPWSVIAGAGTAAAVPAADAYVGLDLTLRVRDATGERARLIWSAGGVTPTSCPTDALPECDDRVWFRPQLSP